jgi:hypothetical protein
MPKIPIKRQELSAKVLAAIREHPKCVSVKEIAITPELILGAGTTWHVNIIDSGDVDVELAYRLYRPRTTN